MLVIFVPEFLTILQEEVDDQQACAYPNISHHRIQR